MGGFPPAALLITDAQKRCLGYIETDQAVVRSSLQATIIQRLQGKVFDWVLRMCCVIRICLRQLQPAPLAGNMTPIGLRSES